MNDHVLRYLDRNEDFAVIRIARMLLAKRRNELRSYSNKNWSPCQRNDWLLRQELNALIRSSQSESESCGRSRVTDMLSATSCV